MIVLRLMQGRHSVDVDRQLMRAVDIGSCPDWHKLVIIIIDEIHIKEDLVYDKLIGFVNLGEVNNHLLAFERSMEKNDKVPSLANS